MKNGVIAVVVAGMLVFSASGSTLAAGKLGGASQLDGVGRGNAVAVEDEQVGGSLDRPTTQGGTLGVQGGDE